MGVVEEGRGEEGKWCIGAYVREEGGMGRVRRRRMERRRRRNKEERKEKYWEGEDGVEEEQNVEEKRRKGDDDDDDEGEEDERHPHSTLPIRANPLLGIHFCCTPRRNAIFI